MKKKNATKVRQTKNLKISIFCLMFASLFISVSLSAAKFETPKSNRTKYNFNPDWKFIKENPADAQKTIFDDTKWETISCPHTFNDDDTFDDYMQGGHKGESNQWRGTVWYRKHFKLDSKTKNKKVFIEFESVRQIADVYINGVHVGTNKNGFIPFGYDLTPYLNACGKDNILAVRVNNDRKELFNNNAPLTWNHEHWHPNHGGIYRNVYLYTLDKVHITLPLFDNLKTIGTYVYTQNVSAKSADVAVEVEAKNDDNKNQTVTFEASIVDNDGVNVGSVTETKELKAGEKVIFKGLKTLQNPNRWYTRKPYMYKMLSTLKIANKIVDAYETPFGIRSFDFNKDSGLWLNEEHVKLHGWGQKPTNEWPGIGAALPDWLHEFTYKLMDEAGGNFMRWGHCAGGPSSITAGDKYGFVTLMPGVSGESDNFDEGWDVRIAAFRDMLVYYRNHPSIFIYEGGNWAIVPEHFQQIVDIINKYDPNGKRLLGNRRAEVGTNAGKYVTIEIGTEGWNREFPNLPIVESEYCRDEAPRRVWDSQSLPFYGKYPRKELNQYKWDSEQYAIIQANHWWNKMGKKPYHAGGANWIFTDGTHGGRNQSEVTRSSGEVDGARLPKEAFYALKSMWRPEPQAHILGHWTYEAGVKKDIFVISNCSKVELYVNGVLKGTNTKPEFGYVYKFPEISFEKGQIKTIGYIDNVVRVSQQKETVGDKKSIKLTALKGINGWRADGSDIVLVDVEVVDSKGQRCPTNQQDIQFEVSGEGEWRGGYNSNTPENTRKLKLYTECGINRVSVRSSRKAGSFTIKASGEGVESTSITIQSEPVKIKNGLTLEQPQLYSVASVKSEPIPVPIPEIVADKKDYKQVKSELFKNFSYTGEGKAMIKFNLQIGDTVYTDRTTTYSSIPNYLLGSEYIQTPDADNIYWARDQLQFLSTENIVVYVAHQIRLEVPEFLKDYEVTGERIEIKSVNHILYKKIFPKGSEVIMAGNVDSNPSRESKMYVVFVLKTKSKN